MKRLLIISSLIPIIINAIILDKEEFKSSFNSGKRIYQETCISCHGSDGKANTNMNLVVKPRALTETILDQNQIAKVVTNGSHTYGAKSDIMPSFKFVYDEDEISDIALYVYESFAKTQHNKFLTHLDESKDNNKISLKKGKKIFKRNCSLCHGITGNGKSDFVKESKGQDNFIYPYNLQKILLSEDQIFLYAKFGGKYWGTNKNDMPSWKAKYNDNILKSVAKYIVDNIKKDN